MAEFNLARIRYTWKNVWLAGATYIKDDIVRHGGNTYVCMEGHLSDQTSFTTDLGYATPKWLLMGDGYQWKGNWAVETRYRVNDLFKYNATIYRVTEEHVSGTSATDGITNDIDKVIGYAYTPDWRSQWGPLTRYRFNDVVRYNGVVYKCVTEHTSSSISAGLEQNQASWTVVFKGNNFRIDWAPSTRYTVDDVVKYGAIVYRCNQGHTSAATTTLGLEQDDTKWDVVLSGIDYKGYWQNNGDSSGVRYKVGDLVKYGPTVWRCKTAHTSLANFAEANFDIWMPGLGFEAEWTNATSYQPGDIVRYGGYTYTSMTNNLGSAPSVTGVFYEGESLQGLYDWELLITGYAFKGAWDAAENYKTGDVVRNSGWVYIAVQDSLNQQPDSLDPESANYYDPGETRSANGGYSLYWQLLITGNAYKGEWKTTVDYVLGDIVVQAGTTWKCIQAHEGDDSSLVEPSLDATNSYWTKHIQGAPGNVMQYRGDLRTHDGTAHLKRAIGSPGDAFKVISGTNNWEALGQQAKIFYVATTGVDAAGAGLAPTSPFASIKYATQYILADEAARAPATIFVSTGIYEEILPIKVPAGVAIVGDELRSTTIKPAEGFESDYDMFQVRNGCGIRNMTLEGLTGILGSPDTYGAQVPVGGSFVALDPGSGPADTSVWITTKSTYVQNVTTIGSACVGLKIDGALHNGGNKSIVANDFTQVISDGIGVWANKDGRAELVSVFTYYCSVGYFAEDGGVIRAANGNNSYGSWGAIADGNDPAETPDAATVWNRNNEATVSSGFIGGATDEIKALEYSHAGQHYTTVTPTIVGAGAGESLVFDDFRDLAISQVRRINTTGSGSEGGSNYLVRQGFAQVTSDATSTIKISATDVTQFLSEIDGHRLIIISGPATGQYGYIDSFSAVSKETGIKKESDDSAGWDHIIPGTPLVASFDSTTQYRIEPRVEVSSPGLSSTSHPLTNARTFDDAAEGGNSVTYPSITIGLGTGVVEGITQASAVYSVLRTGKLYTPTQVSGGAGYAVGDKITVPGTAMGGVTPDNDLIITVATVSDDSTNSILTQTYSGVGREPRLIASAQPNYMVYSDDAGLTWTETTHDVSGTIHTVVAGNDRFIGVGGQINQYIFSLNGEVWTTRSLPGANNWKHATYGGGKFVICSAAYANFLYSTDGLAWTAVAHGGAVSAFSKVAYGQGKFISVSDEDRAVTISSDGITWNRTNNALPAAFATSNNIEFAGFAYGANRFVGISDSGKTCFSVDEGATWIAGGDVPQNGGSTLQFSGLKYGNGVWMAIAKDNGTGPTNLVAVTQDGITWSQYNLDASQTWGALAYTSNNNDPKFVCIGNGANTNAVVKARTGAKAILRANIQSGKISEFKIWNPGGGYVTPPTVTVTDQQAISLVEPQVRLSSGVLGQPTFNSRGAGFRTGSTTITLVGDGYAEIIEQSNKLTLAGVDTVPGPGVQIRIAGILDTATADPDDLKLYNGVKATDLGDDGSGNGTRLVQFQISPSLDNTDNLEHGVSVELRSKYSQCRIAGHDFLDIGTGNFANTNYPSLYSDGNYFVSAPENEVYETNGGRVFYTSTDQDGNFRTGELFAVNQATGIVTISAQFFDLDGLSELSLGGVRLGGSGASIQEFSTDATMSADSNNVIPTQRAIATFLSDRLSVGGEDLQTNLLQAGFVQLGGEDNRIDMNNNEILQFNRPVVIGGIGEDGVTPAGIGGTIISQMLLVRNFNDTVQ